jgi:quinol monooxygenase YgiN
MGGVIPGVTPIPTTAARCASHRRAAFPLALAWTSGSNGVAGKLGCKRLSAAIGPSLLALEQLEGMMIVLRFRGQCQPDKLEEALAAFRAVVAPSRELDGVISFDVAQDVTDPNTVIAVEVAEDQDAYDRANALPQVARVMELLPSTLAAAPEATAFHVSSSESRL